MSRHRQRPPIVAILFLIAFLLGVLYFLGSRQLNNSKAHRLRLLAGFADRVESTVPDLAERFARIAGQTAVLESCDAPVEEPTSELVGPATEETPEDPSTEPTVAAPELAPRSEQKAVCREAKVREYVEQIPNLTFVSDRMRIEDEAEDEDPGKGENQARRDPVAARDLPAAPAIELKPLGKVLYIIHREQVGTEPATFREVRAKLDLEDLLAPAVLPNVFEAIFVASVMPDGAGERVPGTVLFQHGEPEVRLTSLVPVFGTFDGASSDRAADAGSPRARFFTGENVEENLGDTPQYPATGSIPVRVAEVEYRLFLQPVVLELPHLRQEQSPRPVHWVAGGFVSRDRLLSASLTTSPVLLGLLLAIFPLAVVAWPFLKLWLVSPRQRIQRSDAAFLILSMFLGCFFITSMTLTLDFMARNRLQVDRQLEGVAGAIETGFLGELQKAHQQLQALDEQSIRQAISKQPQESAEPPESQESQGSEGAQGLPEGAYSSSPAEVEGWDVPLDDHPVFHSVFWVNEQGEQLLKLALRDHSKRFSNVRERKYFQCAVGRQEPYRIRFSESSEPVRLCLQSVISNTGGADQTILALPLDQARLPATADDKNDCVAGRCRPVMATRFASLTEPWLPSTYGFAIVDTSAQGQARVLFHSDTRRILSEDLLQASDEDPVLTAMLEGRRIGPLTIRYWGERYRAYVTPLEGLPWSLVTFRNLTDLRLRTIELVYDLFNPFLAFMAFVLLVFGLLMLLMRHRVRGALWPDPRKNPAYLAIVLLVLGTTAGYTLLLSLQSMLFPGFATALAWSTLLLPTCVLAISLGILAWLHHREHLVRPWGVRRPAGLWQRFGNWVAEQVGRPWASLGSRRGAEVVATVTGILALLALLLSKFSIPILLLAASVCVIAFSLEPLHKNFAGNQRRRSYVFAMSCLLFATTIVPAVGLYVLAEERQRTFIVQDVQEDVAESRERAVAATMESRGEEGAFFQEYRAVLRSIWTKQVASVFSTSGLQCVLDVDCSLPDAGWPWRGWTAAVFAARPIPVNDLSSDPQGIDLSRFETLKGRWRIQGDDWLRASLQGVIPSRMGTGETWLWTSELPPSGFPQVDIQGLVKVRTLLLATLFVATVGFPFLLIYTLAHRLLFVALAGVDPGRENEDRKNPDESSLGEEDPQGTGEPRRPLGDDDLVVRDLGDLRKLLSAEHLARSTERKALVVLGVPRLAMDTFDDPEQYHAFHWDHLDSQGLTTLPPGDSRPVVIMGLWPELEEPRVELSRLHALERLLQRKERAVVILSQLDPRWLVESVEPEGTLLAVAVRRQWISLLGSFTFWYAADRGGPEFLSTLRTQLLKVLRKLRALKQQAVEEAVLQTEDDKGGENEPSEGNLSEDTVRSATTLTNRLAKRLKKLKIFGPGETREEGAEADEQEPPDGNPDQTTSTIKKGADEDESEPSDEVEGRAAKQTEQEEQKTEIAEEWRQRIEGTYQAFDILYLECRPTRRLQQIAVELMEGIKADDYEAFTEDKLVGKIALAARSYYQAIWSSTSEQEKVVLAQLAHEGLVSPRNHGVVLDLMYRGLIVRDPELRLMNDSFGLFIRQTAGHTKLLEWEAEEATSLWSILRWLLPVPLLLLGAFLFVTQRDAVSSAVGFVLAAASVAPTLVNLFGYFEQRFARGTAEKEAKAGAKI